MTSRRAKKRQARERVAVAAAPAPGRALERWRPPEVAPIFGGEALAASVRELEALTAAMVVAHLDGDPAAHAAALEWFLEHPLAGFGWQQHHLAARVDPGERASRGTHPGDGRPKLCFPAALEYLLEHADVPGLRMVHGLIREQGMYWSHAWVEIHGGLAVYDPTTSRFYRGDAWQEVMGAVTVCTYTPQQAAARLLEEGTRHRGGVPTGRLGSGGAVGAVARTAQP